MIKATFSKVTRRIEARLEDRVRRLALVRAERARAAARQDGAQWRSPSLLWPYFSKDR